MKVVRAIEMITRDEIKEGAVICDPACGVGKFLLEPIKSKLDHFYKIENGKIIPKITIRGFDKGFDKDEQKTIILAKANMLIYFSEIIKNYPNHTKEFADLFNSTFTLKTDSILGTLRDPIENIYDLILTNPPYVTSGSSNLKEEIQKDNALKKYYKVNAMGVEGLFMEWIIRALKPNGKAFIIVPDGIFNRQNYKNLRAFLRQECFIDGIISLPVDTFFTTNKKTYILCITKKNSKADIQSDPVFTYLVSEIGESRDVYRFDIEQNDLMEATTLYNFFKGNKKAFEAINKDLRCKIVPIEKFESDSHWSVDRWWSKEEKIALGIQEKDKTINVLELSSLVSDMADTFGSFSAILKEVGEKKSLENEKLGFCKVRLDDIFDFLKRTNGSFLTKTFINQHAGNIPVYSASIDPSFVNYGYVQDNLPNVKYFHDCMTWNIDGSIGKVFIRKGRFSLSEKVIPLILFPQYKDHLNIYYLKYSIEQEAKKINFCFTNKAGKSRFSKIIISIPIDANGLFSLEAQQYIVEQHNIIADFKAKAKEYEQTLNEIKITTCNKNIAKSKEVRIGDIFDLPSIKGLTKSFIEANKGNVPVYGGKKDEEPIGYIKDNLNNVAYFENCLAWNREGSVGYVFYHKNKFTTNDHHRPMIIKEEYTQILDIEYMRYAIENVLLAQGFKWSKTASKEKVANLLVNIPITLTGEFDIEKQQEIATKYKKVEETKKLIQEELKRIQEFSLVI